MLLVIILIILLLTATIIFATSKKHTKRYLDEFNFSSHPRFLYNHTLVDLDYEIFYEDGKKITGTVLNGDGVDVDLQNLKGVNFYLQNLYPKGKGFASYISTFPVTRLMIGKVFAKKQHETTSAPAIKDMANIRIHNLTNVDISFNGGEVVVPANSMQTYDGVDKEGITINEIITNDQGLFKDFKIKRKVTDVYYGIISDNDIPSFTERYLF